MFNLFAETPVKKSLTDILAPFQTMISDLQEFIADRKQEAADYQSMIESATASKAEVEAEAKAAEKSLAQVQKFL